ncbi:YqzE family protein [Oceanobacillus halotolerans]|uniref:YqzE family protein n=1 Tax=Oceanobacillus halotolerans TaxID=2663380 RepID=UPI0013D98CF1|nr:YqzE family protein [Oceanobacillus halotolerans]
MSGNDYVKYLTESFVSYIDSPPEERKRKRKRNKQPETVISNRWFGVLPFSLKFIRKKTKK